MTQLSIALVLLGLMALVGWLAWLRMGVDTGAAIAVLDRRLRLLEGDPGIKALDARVSKLEELRPFIDDMKLRMSLEGR